MLNDHQWKLHYLLIGIGLILLAQARIHVYRLYSEELRKNRTSAHGWKIPLVVVQILLLQAAGLYGLLIGFHVISEPFRNLIFYFSIGFILIIYLFWYLIAHYQNRYKNLAGLHIARTSLILAVISFFAWTLGQFVILSLLAGFFSLVSLLLSLGLAPLSKEEQRGNWLRVYFLMGSILLLIPVGLASNPFNKDVASLVNLGPAMQNLNGKIDNLTYAPDSKKLVFTQKNSEGWFLCLLDPEAADKKLVKYQAGDGAFTPIFVEQGSSLIVDLLKEKNRDLYLLNIEKGTLKALTHSGVEPLQGGIPWSEKNRQFLYVTKSAKGYELNSINLTTTKSTKLFTTPKPILSPAWVGTGYQIAYTDGDCERPYVYDMELKATKALFSDDEKAQITASGGKLKMGFPAFEVLPSPDAFRYLFKCKKGDATVIETALADGSKANEMYRADQPIEHLAWMDLGQKIVFEESGRQAMYFMKSKQIKIEDANQGIIESLIWPQFSHQSPAASPDGVKVAFVSSSGLWYPALGLSESSGIWVAVLR